MPPRAGWSWSPAGGPTASRRQARLCWRTWPRAKSLPVSAAQSTAQVKAGKTTAPKHYTEDTLLSAMETAGAGDMPEDAERKGIGTPAMRAATLEKLVSAGFVQRKKAKKVVSLLPTPTGTALITVLPEALQSPALTAEWEHHLKEVERGTLASEDFMAEISAMLRELAGTVRPVEGGDVLFLRSVRRWAGAPVWESRH